MSNNEKVIIDIGNENSGKEKISSSLLFRLMIMFQIIAYGSYSVLVHLCKQNGEIMFSSTIMNLIIELFKLIISIVIFCSKINLLNEIKLKYSISYSIPGLLYFINNNLAVHIQVYMDPASYQILSNFKIVTTAILYRIIIKQTLSKKQWFAISLLFIGGLFYSIGKQIPFLSFTNIEMFFQICWKRRSEFRFSII
jgi:probable UDP-sugar transporter A4